MSAAFQPPSPETASLHRLLEACHALSQHTDQHLLGLLSKHASADTQTALREQLPTLRHLVRSGAHLREQLQQGQQAWAQAPSKPQPGAELPTQPEPLSAREGEVLRLLAKGYTQQQIADALFISPTTVNNHYARIRQKLGLKGRNSLISFAVTHFLNNHSMDL
ncbi:helix-turn-helix transcriptional regulator [Hymenobacter latericus]|uniref:helix-turn-helix transcriptional regulator n=1 Tax=Hymenobacter sp. YIM 151858-1 TaxID=2987688 RepID=UPI0022260A1D|nr:LuxR C-terminal-related transcriptional regulator [Hymenobacter sp. YIM 151858-1]UYZ58731.1 LuxR C-terminal-related transcriptional regulator [Hymenobacter sp. YIM 151858-1]